MKEQIYLPGLNGIRAIAAVTVLIFHIDIFIPSFNLKPIGYGNTGMAGYGVVLFFVLSGCGTKNAIKTTMSSTLK